MANKLIPLPNVSQSFKLKRDMNIFLEMAHDRVKEEVATLRKEGKIQPEPKKEKKEIDFDKEMITKAFERYKEKTVGVNELLGLRDFDKNFTKYSFFELISFNSLIFPLILKYLKKKLIFVPLFKICFISFEKSLNK